MSKKTANVNTGYRYPRDVVRFNISAEDKYCHPTQKPLALLRYLIQTYSNENDIVLDNCCGSGSTCVAAKQTNRRYIGIELNENYFEIANKINSKNIKKLDALLGVSSFLFFKGKISNIMKKVFIKIKKSCIISILL